MNLIVALVWAAAIFLWIWRRREARAKPKADPAVAAHDAASQAEELAEKTRARQAPTPQPEPDDLTRIKGIGAVFAAILNEAGINTYAGLAAASPAQITAIFEAAGRSRPPRLETWMPQARYAAARDWDGLARYLEET